jgi:hypothetical protein
VELNLLPPRRVDRLVEPLSRLLVLARMWEDWVPHLNGSITAGARDRGAGKFASTQKGGPYTGWTLTWVDLKLGGP